MSGTIGEERAIQALKHGAVDYVLKENRARLVPAIERALREVEDRDARRWAQRELEESEERFRFAMHFSPIGMALVAPDGRWLAVNPALCKIVGYRETELLASDVQSITFPEDRDVDAVHFRLVLERAMETYQTNKRYVRKDGRVVWTQSSGSLVWLQTGEPHYFICQVQDITDRVRAEQALRDSEERFRSIAEATQEWIWEIDADGTYTFCSPAVESILGHASNHLIGKNCLDIVSPITVRYGRILCGAESPRSAGGATCSCICGTRRRGPLARQQCAAAARCARGRGRLSRVARDITDRRLQQERIARLSRIQAVLSGINSTIVRVRDRHELLRETCRIAAEEGGFRMAWIGLVGPGEMKATPLVWEGFDQGYLQEIDSALAALAEDPGPVGEALRHKKVVVVNNIEADERFVFKQEALVRGFRSQMAMPLTVGEEVVAVLACMRRKPASSTTKN